MALSRDDFKIQEARLKYRTAQLVLVTAIIGFLSFVAYELIRYWRYTHVPKKFEKSAGEARRPPEGPGPRPFIKAEAVGPHLRIEAGLDIQVDANTNPDGTGVLEAGVTDFPPGVYRVEEAPHAAEVLSLLESSLGDFLSDDLSGFSVEMEVIGSADGLPVRHGAVYKGDLGSIYEAPYYSYDRGGSALMSLLAGETPLTNEAIAFLRAYDLLRHTTSISPLRGSEALIGVDTTSAIGGLHRRVIVRVSIKNALEEEYQDLGPVFKRFFVPGGPA